MIHRVGLLLLGHTVSSLTVHWNMNSFFYIKFIGLEFPKEFWTKSELNRACWVSFFSWTRGNKSACCNCRLLFLGPETELVLAHVVVGAGLLSHLALSPVDRQLTEPVTKIGVVRALHILSKF